MTTTPVATDGPALVTVTVQATVDPATAVAGPDFVMPRSATDVTGVVLVAVLSVGSRSAVGLDTVAVLVSVTAARSGATVPVIVTATTAPGAMITERTRDLGRARRREIDGGDDIAEPGGDDIVDGHGVCHRRTVVGDGQRPRERRPAGRPGRAPPPW